MRRLAIGVAFMTLAACSKAPDRSAPAGGEAGDTVTAAAGVALAYSYVYRLPSARIADAQEAHARACEQLGIARCRITGMTYRVDDAGTVSASLDVKLAAPLARSFGRTGTRMVEQAGGALVGADIGGTDVQPATAQANADAGAADADLAKVGRELARPGLSARERASLRDQQASATERRRTADAALAGARASVATTPMSFAYHAGSGIGLSARLGDAWQTGIASVGLTLGFALTALAALGPPALLLLVLLILWWRVGRFAWRRLAGVRDEAS